MFSAPPPPPPHFQSSSAGHVLSRNADTPQSEDSCDLKARHRRFFGRNSQTKSNIRKGAVDPTLLGRWFSVAIVTLSLLHTSDAIARVKKTSGSRHWRYSCLCYCVASVKKALGKPPRTSVHVEPRHIYHYH